jgi:hypothetical protein
VTRIVLVEVVVVVNAAYEMTTDGRLVANGRLVVKNSVLVGVITMEVVV